MNYYHVYAKKLQNNIGDEPSFVGGYEGYSKENAMFVAMNDPTNDGFYNLNSFFAICKIWKFEKVFSEVPK